MKLLHAIPALPVYDISRSITFYRTTLGWTVLHQEPGFAIVQRDDVTLHLWAAADETWQTRSGGPPVVSGAESFIAGTASCRVHVDGVESLYRRLEPLGIVHPNGRLHATPWGTREFGILDPDRNLITFAERVAAPAPA